LSIAGHCQHLSSPDDESDSAEVSGEDCKVSRNFGLERVADMANGIEDLE